MKEKIDVGKLIMSIAILRHEAYVYCLDYGDSFAHMQKSAQCSY